MTYLSKICVWDADCVWGVSDKMIECSKLHNLHNLPRNNELSPGDIVEIQQVLIINRSSDDICEYCRWITDQLLDYSADYYITGKERFQNEVPIIMEMLKNAQNHRKCSIITIAEYHDLRDTGVIL